MGWKTLKKGYSCRLVQGKVPSCVSHANIVILTIVISSFFLFPSYGRLCFRLCIIHLTALTNTVLSVLDTVNM